MGGSTKPASRWGKLMLLKKGCFLGLSDFSLWRKEVINQPSQEMFKQHEECGAFLMIAFHFHYKDIKNSSETGVVVHTCNPSTQRPAWATEQDPVSKPKWIVSFKITPNSTRHRWWFHCLRPHTDGVRVCCQPWCPGSLVTATSESLGGWIQVALP
jgi:hypothetical protein